MRKVPESKKRDLCVEDFACIRLKDAIHDRSLVQKLNFIRSEKNHSLAAYLHFRGKLEENNNTRAFYVIIDEKNHNNIVMFFSLQAGATIKCHEKRIGGVIFDERLQANIIQDDKLEVGTIVPVVEIPHFCVNDVYRSKVKTWKVNHNGRTITVGTYVFYQFIAPIILDAADKIGVQYVILFCSDDGTEKLYAHYKSLGFKKMDDMACLRDSYSQGLDCMTVKIKELRKKAECFHSIKTE